MHRLPECAVARRVPRRKPHPLLSARVERNSEAVTAERRLIGSRDDLAIGLLAIAPDYLDEFQWERPLQIRHDGSLIARAFQAKALEQHFAARDEEVAGPH